MPPLSGAPTPLFRIYRTATRVIAPLAYRSVARKLRAHGVPRDRIAERMGHATLPRPAAPVIWFHAASVGESLSILTLIAHLGHRLPTHEFLITSGTATSAALIAKRLPPRTRHQFPPLDAPAPVARFLAHWRPVAGVFVESELWPVTLVSARNSGARLALLNARLSEKSVRGWCKWPDTARFILDQFAVMLTQNRKATDNLLAMGADPGRLSTGVNLKSTSDPLPVDTGTRDEIGAALAGRPTWVASSTHAGEEETVIAAHTRLLATRPDLCLLLVPRHPERGEEVAALLAEAGLTTARRTKGEAITPQTQVYLADTLGETGTWYALSPIVFLGGSLRPIGGHNPFEPAQSGAAVLTGPHVTNFAETFDPLIALGGAVQIRDDRELARQIDTWLTNSTQLETARAAAGKFADSRQAALADVVETLCTALALDDGHA